MGIYWRILRICFNKDLLYQNRESLVLISRLPIKESDTSRHKSIQYRRITNVCQARVLFCFQRALGIGLKDRMHSRRY